MGSSALLLPTSEILGGGYDKQFDGRLGKHQTCLHNSRGPEKFEFSGSRRTFFHN